LIKPLAQADGQTPKGIIGENPNLGGQTALPEDRLSLIILDFYVMSIENTNIGHATVSGHADVTAIHFLIVS